jgi:hypothetical protein
LPTISYTLPTFLSSARGAAVLGLALAFTPLGACQEGEHVRPVATFTPGTPAGEENGAGGAPGCSEGVANEMLIRLREVPGMVAARAETDAPGACAFQLEFEQPVDHGAPTGARFLQRARLLHRGPNAPTSLATTGYALFRRRNDDTELSYLLGANLLFVEHRYFVPSTPEPLDWRYLTIEQAAADHHHFVEALRPFYPGPWLSEGVSKGGMTTVYHRRFYPDDVVGTVAYVAPHSAGPADGRYGAFLERVGDQACRDRLVALQREALTPPRRERLVRAMVEAGAATGHTFDTFGPDKIYEFALGESRFLFWQYQNAARCAELPAPEAGDGELYEFFDSVASFANFYDDKSLADFAPYYYQAATQLGGPGPIELHLDGVLAYPGENVVSAYPPAGVAKTFDPAAMADVGAWVASSAERILFVYGEYDPWSAAAFEPSGARETLRLVVPRGNHGSGLLDLPEADRGPALAALKAWSGVEPRAPDGPTRAASLAAAWRADRARPRPAGPLAP